MENRKKQRSVVPVYLVALLWAVGGFGFRIHTVPQILLFVVLSAVILLVGSFVCRRRADAAWEDAPEEAMFEAEEEPEEIPEPYIPESPEADALREDRDCAIREMRRINDGIGDSLISLQIDRIESATDRMCVCVAHQPEKASEVRRFLNYYLPTTLKLLHTYERLNETASSATNVEGAKQKIAALMRTIVQTFDHQLAALDRGETMDINAEVQVLYRVLNEDGHSNGNTMASSDRTRK